MNSSSVKPSIRLFTIVIAVLSFAQAKCQIYTAIIGDNDYVATRTFPRNEPCNTKVEYIGQLTFDKYFKQNGDPDNSPQKYMKFYFAPASSDTVTECFTYTIKYEYVDRCPVTKSVTWCFSGYGISPDSLVLIRPLISEHLIVRDTQEKKYQGVFILKVSNNTASTVTIKDIQFSVNSVSKIDLLSFKDSSGNPISTIEPFVQNFPILFEVESKIAVLQSSKIYPATIQFFVSRLGRDSIYTNHVLLKLPEYVDASIRKTPTIHVENLTVSPNPLTNRLMFAKPESPVAQCEIFDQLGNKMCTPEFTLGSDNITISALNLRNGVYHLKVTTLEKIFFTKIMVLQ